MSTKKIIFALMASLAMSFLQNDDLFASSEKKLFVPKIQTPHTASELRNSGGKAKPIEEEFGERESQSTDVSSKRLQKHGLGLGLGQTFLLGNYSNYGNNKITFDLFYTYAASYSFDLLVNAHLSEHQDENEKLKLRGLSSSIKGRFVEYDGLSPYFLGGLGFYAPKAKRASGATAKWTDQKLTFGLNFGTGLDLRLNDHYVIGLLGQMHWPFKVQQDEQSDLKGYYFKLLLTGMYLF